MRAMDVLHLSRKSGQGISIERLFRDIADASPAGARPKRREAPFHGGANLAAVLANIAWARTLRADVFHVIGSEHYLALGLPAARTVVTVHDCHLLNLKAGPERQVLRDLWFRRPLARCARTVAISQFTRQNLAELAGIDPATISVIYDCISDGFFQRRRHKDLAPQPRILHIGTADHKNLGRHVAALVGTHCHLRIVGRLSEPQRTLLDASGLDYSSVHRISDAQLFDEYVKADLLLFASTYEGFGLPIAEAQAVGLPVVTSNLCSMPEVAGGAAVLVDPTSVDEIRVAVATLLEDASYLRDLVQRAFDNVERFRPARIAAEYHQLYRELAG